MGFLRNLLSAEASPSERLETYTVTLPNGRTISQGLPIGATDAEVRRAFAPHLASAGFRDPDRHEILRPTLGPGGVSPLSPIPLGSSASEPGSATAISATQPIVENALAPPSRLARFQGQNPPAFVPSGTLRPYYPAFGERIENRIREGLLGLGMGQYNAENLSGAARDVPFVGDMMMAGDAGDAYSRGNLLEGFGQTGLAMVGIIPGLGDALANAGRRGLAKARQAARARALGYSDTPYWHGDRWIDADSPLPDQYRPGTFFSDRQEVADEYARVGGRPNAREFRLRINRPVQGTAGDVATIIETLRRRDQHSLAEEIASIWDRTADQFISDALRDPDKFVIGPNHVYRWLEVRTGSGAGPILRDAGYDALVSGDETLMLTDEGIRLASARFDPNRRNSTNIRHVIALPVAAGVGAYSIAPGQNEE